MTQECCVHQYFAGDYNAHRSLERWVPDVAPYTET